MPSLPAELERLIFEIAALQDTDHNNRVQLILVAKRVYEWIRPILYRVVAIVVKPRSWLRAPGALIIHDWPNAQIINSAQFVRHVLTMESKEHHLLEMLSTFPNIENLAIWGSIVSSEILKKISDLPLRILSATFNDDRYIIENPSAFTNLTHLDMLNLHCSAPGWHKALIGLPKLTHLSFDPAFLVGDAVVLDLLKSCASLRVLIFLVFVGMGVVPDGLFTGDDPRCLVLLDRMTMIDLTEEWERSANGLIGCWELAEIIVDARRDNLFKDKSCFIFSRKSWMEHLNEDGKRWYERRSRGLGNGI